MIRSNRPLFIFLFISLLGITSVLFQHCTRVNQQSERVILIGIDGMGVPGFQDARTPNLDELVRNGALSLQTRAVMPTVSAPNWGSHLLGAGPEQHGITYNGWTTDNHTVEPTFQDEDGYFPSVFSVIRDQKPEAILGFFYDWNALADLYNIDKIDEVVFSDGYAATFEKAIPWIIKNDPGFTFLYMGHPDGAGHSHQWGSHEYIQALEDVDVALGEFFEALKIAGMYENTHFLVVSDHGGQGYGHGGLSMEEIEVPWIITGPGVIKNRIIEQPNDVYNTAASIIYLLGLEQPEAWIGHPVYGAFEHEKASGSNDRAYVPQPKCTHESGLYTQSEAVELSVNDPKVKIRYTMDGSNPSSSSPIYKSPILIQKSAIIKAAGSMDEHLSRITTIDFKKVLGARNISLNEMPDEKYPGKGPFTLLNLKRGSSDYHDGQWLGFNGHDLEAKLTFEGLSNISKVTIGVMNNPGSWIFPPTSIQVMGSVNGTAYQVIGSLNSEQIGARLKNGRLDLEIIVTHAQVKFLKLFVENKGVCPVGHAGEGEPAWLFVDEIIME